MKNYVRANELCKSGKLIRWCCAPLCGERKKVVGVCVVADRS